MYVFNRQSNNNNVIEENILLGALFGDIVILALSKKLRLFAIEMK